MAEGEMMAWHHLLNGHEFEQSPGDGEEQGRLACCSPWGHKELDTTEQLNDNNLHTTTQMLLRSAPIFSAQCWTFLSMVLIELLLIN